MSDRTQPGAATFTPIAEIGRSFSAVSDSGLAARGTIIAATDGKTGVKCDKCSHPATYEYLVAGSQLLWFRCWKHRYEGSPR